MAREPSPEATGEASSVPPLALAVATGLLRLLRTELLDARDRQAAAESRARRLELQAEEAAGEIAALEAQLQEGRASRSSERLRAAAEQLLAEQVEHEAQEMLQSTVASLRQEVRDSQSCRQHTEELLEASRRRCEELQAVLAKCACRELDGGPGAEPRPESPEWSPQPAGDSPTVEGDADVRFWRAATAAAERRAEDALAGRIAAAAKLQCQEAKLVVLEAQMAETVDANAVLVARMAETADQNESLRLTLASLQMRSETSNREVYGTIDRAELATARCSQDAACQTWLAEEASGPEMVVATPTQQAVSSDRSGESSLSGVGQPAPAHAANVDFASAPSPRPTARRSLEKVLGNRASWSPRRASRGLLPLGPPRRGPSTPGSPVAERRPGQSGSPRGSPVERRAGWVGQSPGLPPRRTDGALASVPWERPHPERSPRSPAPAGPEPRSRPSCRYCGCGEADSQEHRLLRCGLHASLRAQLARACESTVPGSWSLTDDRQRYAFLLRDTRVQRPLNVFFQRCVRERDSALLSGDACVREGCRSLAPSTPRSLLEERWAAQRGG